MIKVIVETDTQLQACRTSQEGRPMMRDGREHWWVSRRRSQDHEYVDGGDDQSEVTGKSHVVARGSGQERERDHMAYQRSHFPR